MRDKQGRLACPECGRPIGAVTGLDEVLNVRAHVAEHHDRVLDTNEALELRLEWEAVEVATGNLYEQSGGDTTRCEFCGDPLDDSRPWRRGLDGAGAHDDCIPGT